jgi:long-chain acyl-CoA synthetase
LPDESGGRDVAAERAALDAAVEGKTLCDILARNASTFGDRPALSWKQGTTWFRLSWREYREQIAQVALALQELGVGAGDCVAIMARNRPEHVVVDLAALHARATPVSLYNSMAPGQIAYVARHCEAKVAVVEDEDYLRRWDSVVEDLKALEHIVLIDGAPGASEARVITYDDLRARGRAALAADRGRFEDSWRALEPDDPATIVYTSGTTDDPKGVVITNRNALWTAAAVETWGHWPEGFKYVSYLPLAHSLERLAAQWVCLWKAAWVHFCPEIREVFEVLPQVRPYAFVAVPRLWEKAEAGIMSRLQDEPNERRRRIALKAIEVGREAVRAEQRGQRPPFGVRLQRAVLDRLVSARIRHRIGLDEAGLVLSGAAPLSAEVLEFFFAIGVEITEGYGLSESTAPAAINPPGRARIGTVGPPLPGVEADLGADGELLIRGGNVSPGYHREPEKTSETFDSEGWLHTGDIAEFTDDGYIKIIDRKKELIVTAGGKNVSPAYIENLLLRHALVGQAFVTGDRKPFVAALVALDPEEAESWAAANGLEFSTLGDLAGEQRVRDEIQGAVDAANDKLSRAEAVKRFAVVGEEWKPGGDELTPTLKLKRRAILDKYSSVIDRLYSGASRGGSPT